MSFIQNYKKGLALVIGTLCLLVALWMPGKALLGLAEKSEDLWSSLNWIFLSLGTIFLWGSIVNLAKAIGQGASNIISRKTQ